MKKNPTVIEDHLEQEVLSRYNVRKKNYWVFVLLAFFLGGFGAHRIYLKQWWIVPFYILFAFAIPGSTALVALVELIFTKWIVDSENKKIHNQIREELFPLFVK